MPPFVRKLVITIPIFLPLLQREEIQSQLLVTNSLDYFILKDGHFNLELTI